MFKDIQQEADDQQDEPSFSVKAINRNSLIELNSKRSS